jgi:hypothetical protein
MREYTLDAPLSNYFDLLYSSMVETVDDLDTRVVLSTNRDSYFVPADERFYLLASFLEVYEYWAPPGYPSISSILFAATQLDSCETDDLNNLYIDALGSLLPTPPTS